MKVRLALFRFTPVETRHYELADSGLIRLESASGYRVACHSGWLLISIPGSRGRQGRDIELGPGRSLTIESAGLILVEALGDARLALIAPRSRPSAFVFGRGVVVQVIDKAGAMTAAAHL